MVPGPIFLSIEATLANVATRLRVVANTVGTIELMPSAERCEAIRGCLDQLTEEQLVLEGLIEDEKPKA